MSRQPVCVKCECDLKPEQNGVYCVETAGTERRPYKVWHADLWKCPNCGIEIVSGYGHGPRAVGDEVKSFLSVLFPWEKVIFTHEKWGE